MTTKQNKFLQGLFWYESELPMIYVINKCKERFGSLDEALYIIADAVASGHITERDGILTFVKLT